MSRKKLIGREGGIQGSVADFSGGRAQDPRGSYSRISASFAVPPPFPTATEPE
ncbi:MAG: hypothetical protein OET63_08595 [Desulfobacterales bacterium]|nr:hypothetical protein [Desulfobacterales bacterium]